MTGRSDAQAVLFAGANGTGKTTVIEEIADIMEEHGLRYGAIDLDWLGWFDPGFGDHDAGVPVMLRNLDAVVSNYYSAGVRRFAIAGAVATTDELTDLRNALSMPVTVVRLAVPIEEIERRLGSAITAGRKDDLRMAKEWIAANRGEELGGLVVSNDGPIRDLALGVVSDLGWLGEHERRWDIDERGAGIATGAAFAPNVDELRQAMRGESWVAEDADAHLMPHIRAACDADGSHLDVLDATVVDAVLALDLRWVGGEPGGPDAVRAEVFRVVGSFAEHTTLVAQHAVAHGVEFEIVTGTTSAESSFLPHGHLVRVRVADR